MWDQPHRPLRCVLGSRINQSKGVFVMSDNEFDYEVDDDSNEQEPGNAMKALRRQLAAAKKELSEAKAEADKFRTEQRKSSLGELLEAAGAKKGLAKYFPSDADPTKESVASWLEEDGELFGFVKEPSTVDEQTQNQLQRVSAATEASESTDGDVDIDSMSDADFLAFMSKG